MANENRAHFQVLAHTRLEDAKALLDAGRFDAAYYLAGYGRLRKILQGLAIQGVAFDDISLLSPGDPAYFRLRQDAIGPGEFGGGPAAGHRLRDLVFEDAYVYFL